MKIFDCFMYFDEDIVLDVRLNTLHENVDYFVIVESKFTHKGEKRNLKFDSKKFSKFKDKIIYLVYDNQPSKVESVNKNDTEDEKSTKYIFNAIHRGNPSNDLIAIKYLESLEKIADGNATKIFLPAELSATLGSIGAISELFKDDKENKEESKELTDE